MFDNDRGPWLTNKQNELYPNPHGYATERKVDSDKLVRGPKLTDSPKFFRGPSAMIDAIG